jgi:HK97 family phage major capsid protein
MKTKEQIEIEEKELEEKAKKMAEALRKELGLDNLKSEVMASVNEALKAKETDSVMKVFVAEDTEKSIDELTGKEKSQAFARALFTGNEAVLKALSEGTPADGGMTVPQDFYNTLLEEIQEVAVMRTKVTVIPMSTNVKTFAEIAHGPDVYWTAEGATKTTTTADFSQPTITAYKMAAIIYLTDELIDDSKFDLVNVLVRRFAERIATEEDKVIINGAGTTQPVGIFVNASVPTRACSGNLSFDNIIRLIGDLPVKFRANAAFLVNPVNVTELRLMKDSNGRYLWQDSVAPGVPSTIHGFPVIENYWCPESQIAFGDYRYAYYLGDRQKMTVKITNDTETTFTQDKTAIRVVERIGGDVLFPNAIRKLITIP